MKGSFGSLDKEIWTTMIWGYLDEDDKVFNLIVKVLKENFEDIDAVYRFYNEKNNIYGTHVRLLLVAAMMTNGNILELGAGDHSTKLLHEILEDDNKKEKRLLVSADSNSLWLDRFSDLSSPFHQLLLVQPCAEDDKPILSKPKFNQQLN